MAEPVRPGTMSGSWWGQPPVPRDDITYPEAPVAPPPPPPQTSGPWSDADQMKYIFGNARDRAVNQTRGFGDDRKKLAPVYEEPAGYNTADYLWDNFSLHSWPWAKEIVGHKNSPDTHSRNWRDSQKFRRDEELQWEEDSPVWSSVMNMLARAPYARGGVPGFIASGVANSVMADPPDYPGATLGGRAMQGAIQGVSDAALLYGAPHVGRYVGRKAAESKTGKYIGSSYDQYVKPYVDYLKSGAKSQGSKTLEELTSAAKIVPGQ